MRTRAVPVWQNRERNFVRRIAERQKQALPVPVPIRGAEGSVNRSSPHRVHKVIIDEEVSMSWSNHECGGVPLSRSTRRCPAKVHGLVAIAILTLLPAFAIAADVLPPAQLPESGGGPAPGITPERPSESGVPAIPPSHIDPGIQHAPEKRGDPRGSVKPPNLDPSMSTNPDVAPSPREGINPPGGARPKGKPGAP